MGGSGLVITLSISFLSLKKKRSECCFVLQYKIPAQSPTLWSREIPVKLVSPGSSLEGTGGALNPFAVLRDTETREKACCRMKEQLGPQYPWPDSPFSIYFKCLSVILCI